MTDWPSLLKTWAETGRPLGEFWTLCAREILIILEGEANARHHQLELAYYTAWHSGLFSQPYGRKFPDYKKNAPRRQPTGRRQTPEQMKAMARALTLALGGTIRNRGE